MDINVFQTQTWLNKNYQGIGGYKVITADGITGWGTMKALITALQIEIKIPLPNGNFGPGTKAAFKGLSINSPSTDKNKIFILQGALYCKGYDPKEFTGIFTSLTKNAIIEFQTDAGLANKNGVVDATIMKSLLAMDAFKLLNYGGYNGDAKVRTIQQRLNNDYISNQYFNNDIGLIPCDGIYGRYTNKGLLYALQIEIGISVPNGVFGPGTKGKCPVLTPGSTKTKLIYLLQYALYCNGKEFDPNGFDGQYGNGAKTAVTKFQKFSCLPADGITGMQTWASLLVSNGDTARKGNVCDCATTITAEKAKTLNDNGYIAVGRYLTGMFKMTVTELETIYGNGIKVFPIFETSGTKSSYFTTNKGLADAKSAILAANAMSFLSGTIIYIAVDYDALDYDVTNYIIPYFRAISNEFSINESGYKVGIYGPRNVCSRVAAAGYSCSSFVCDMSSGFSGNIGYSLPNDWAFDQISTVNIGSGLGHIEIDNNIMSSGHSTIYQTNANDWTIDSMKRGWGPITQEAYYTKINGVFSLNIKQNIIDQASKNPSKWTPLLSDYVALGNSFINNEIYNQLTDTKIYDTTKPSFMRIYQYDANTGARHLLDEYKLKPAASFGERLDLGYNSTKKLAFFKGIDKWFIIAGVTAGVYHDYAGMMDEGKTTSTPKVLAALASCVVINSLMAEFCATVGAIAAQAVSPELPIVGAIVGGVVGGAFGYFVSREVGSATEEMLREKLAWLFQEAFGEVIVY